MGNVNSSGEDPPITNVTSPTDATTQENVGIN